MAGIGERPGRLQALLVISPRPTEFSKIRLSNLRYTMFEIMFPKEVGLSCAAGYNIGCIDIA